MFKFNSDIEIYSYDSYNVDSEEENSDGKIRIRNLNV